MILNVGKYMHLPTICITHENLKSHAGSVYKLLYRKADKENRTLLVTEIGLSGVATYAAKS